MSDVSVVDEPVNCVESGVSTEGARVSTEEFVSVVAEEVVSTVATEEALSNDGSFVSTLETAETSSGDSQSANDKSSSANIEGRVAAGESASATDESIISTADLRDVFNRLEVIVQKLARGGAVW